MKVSIILHYIFSFIIHFCLHKILGPLIGDAIKVLLQINFKSQSKFYINHRGYLKGLILTKLIQSIGRVYSKMPRKNAVSLGALYLEDSSNFS